MKKILILAAGLSLVMSLHAQNWTDSEGNAVGQRSKGSRYYTVDRGTSTQRLAAWLRTHTQQEAGKMTCTSDLFVSLSVIDADAGSYVSEVKRGVTVSAELVNGSGKRLYAAVAFVDENERWFNVTSDGGRAVELLAGGKAILPCVIGEEIALGKGHFIMLAFPDSFNMIDVVNKYQSEFLYERNVKAGAALYLVNVKD